MLACELHNNGEQYNNAITAEECRNTPLPLIKAAMKTTYSSWRQTRLLTTDAQATKCLLANEGRRRKMVCDCMTIL